MVKKRFPVVPAVALILKIAAIVFLLVGTFMLVREIIDASKGQMSGFKWTLDIVLTIISKWCEQTLFPAAFAWVAAELILGVREIEFNSRRALLGAGAMTPVQPDAEVMPESEIGKPNVPSPASKPSDEDNPGTKPTA